MNINFNCSLFKKFAFASSLFFCLFTFKSNGQSSGEKFTEITFLGGYTLAETFATTDGFEVYIKDGATYGGSIAFYPNEFFDIAINYTRQETKVNFYDYFSSIYNTDIPASINNITLGFDRNQPLNDMGTAFFFGLNLGAAGLEPKEDQYTGIWKFDVDLHLGAKIFPSPKVGIRLQAGLNSPIQYFGAAFTVGTGGSGGGASATSTITQLYFLGGLIIRMQK